MGPRSTIFCLIPCLVVAGNFSGTVVDLAGTPIRGVAVQSSLSGAAVSDDQGKWLLGSSGVRRTQGLPVAAGSRLGVRAGRLSLSLDGFDAVGRSAGESIEAHPGSAAARTTVVAPDTLVVLWNGKRLIRLPVANDSAPIAFRLDTAWADDAGIGWNPKIVYGTLHDVRDGTAYRTVEIGTQTWMAENLNYTPTNAVYWCDATAECALYHNLYSWTAAMGLDLVYDTTAWNGSDVKHQGICPAGWHLPGDGEWNTLKNTLLTALNGTGGKLKSVRGWSPSGTKSGGGTDDVGFRAIPGGDYESQTFNEQGVTAYFWSATQTSPRRAWNRTLSCCTTGLTSDTLYTTTSGYSVRCVKN